LYPDVANNQDFTIPPHITPLSEYVDYTKDIILFGQAPEPTEEDKIWRLVGLNTNGIKPYGGSADLISVTERLKLLQTGTFALQETNLEWHNKGYRDEFQKNFWSGPLEQRGLMSFICASVINHDITKVMGQ
jgi:hypothetical protein